MLINVLLMDKETNEIVREKSIYFEQQVPTEYVLACYMHPIFEMSGDPKYYVRINRDGVTWEQETLC